MSSTRDFPASIYILSAVVVGTAVGAVFGAIFDDVITGRRTIAVLAALAALAVDYVLRRYLGKALPRVFGTADGLPSPRALFVAGVMAVAGGLAVHDLGLIVGMMTGVALGGFSGLFATLMQAILTMLNAAERRKPTA